MSDPLRLIRPTLYLRHGALKNLHSIRATVIYLQRNALGVWVFYKKVL